MGVNVLILDGHPDEGRLLSHLLDRYQRSLSADASVRRINLRDLSFDLNLRRGYSADQPWEPDLQRVGEALAMCDHLVLGFPLWWGAEPALVKGLVDRLLLPGFAFQYHPENVWWDGLLAGRSADLIVATDTPNWYLKLVYGDPLGRRWRSQILGFCGVKTVRLFAFGPTRRGQAQKRIAQWEEKIARSAATVGGLRRGNKVYAKRDEAGFLAAIKDRKS